MAHEPAYETSCRFHVVCKRSRYFHPVEKVSDEKGAKRQGDNPSAVMRRLKKWVATQLDEGPYYDDEEE